MFHNYLFCFHATLIIYFANSDNFYMFNQGTIIHALVGEQLIKKYEDRPTEGDAVVVHLFKVYDAFGDYRTTTHPYKIGFFQTTFVGKADDFPSEVPEKYLADYNDILGGKLDNSCLVSQKFKFNIPSVFLYLCLIFFLVM